MKKFSFRKISAIATSALMVCSTMGIAAAANYPAPFVVGGTANVAVVYGTGAGVSQLDEVEAANIQGDLAKGVTGGSISVTGGESFQLKKTSDEYNFGDTLDELYPKLDKDEMTFLADGTYNDGDVDEDYDQEIDLPTKALDLFADNDYENDAPTIGFHWANTEEILSYTITYDDDVNYTEMVETDMPLLGGEYYVLAASATQIDILDTSEKITLAVGESVTVDGKVIELTYIDIDSAKISVDGVNFDEPLLENAEEELDDGSYVVLTDIMYQDYSGGSQKAELAVGSGKIELINGEEAELNTKDIDGLEVTITDGSTTSFLSSIKLTWKSHKDTFLTEENSIAMPGFDMIQLAFGGLTFPSDSEEISVDNGEVLTIEMDNYDLPLMWYNDSSASANQKFGEDGYELKINESTNFTYMEAGYNNASTLFWNGLMLGNGTTAATFNRSNTMATATVGNLSEDDRFLVTLINKDVSDVETGYYEVNEITIDDASSWTIELTDLIGDNDLLFEDDMFDTDEIGDITVNHVGFSKDNTSAIFEFNTTASGTIYFNKAVSEKGLIFTFPTSITVATDGTGYNITFQEEDKEDELANGVQSYFLVKNTTNDKYHVSAHGVTDYEVADNDWLGYVVSDLASKVTFDDSADENEFAIDYYGAEVTADVQVVAGGKITSGTEGSHGVLYVKDTEVSDVKAKNLIVVGGSCINSAAASLVGGAYCGAAWTEATGVGSGQFLIKSYSDSSISDKIALLVAGYDAADTVNAATYLRTKTVDTSKEYKGTSSTSAELVVTEE